jgi:tetratricopeptide (TPR) repeat protein
MPFEAHFTEELRDSLRLRRIAKGAAMLDRAEAELVELRPGDPDAASLLLLMAQWVDVGYRDHDFLDMLLLRFSDDSRSKLLIGDFLRLRMAEAFCALSAEEADAAIEILDWVLKAKRCLPEPELEALAHFWKGRAHRKRGEYEAALDHIVQARELSQQSRADFKFAAVIQVHESWLLFQKGMRKEAWRLLEQAESALKSTDHYVALGNIESARGRFVRRLGEYSKALEHFERAIAIYSRTDPKHRNVARTLVNAAYVKRLLALKLRWKIEKRTHPERGRASAGAKQPAGDRGGLRARYQQLCEEAIADLRRAREIYVLHKHHGGMGNVMLNLGRLHLDRGAVDQAEEEGNEAYRLGLEKNDPILMARARILLAATENVRVEEQMEDGVDIAVYANRAREYSEEAMTLARSTQNRRLVAGACIARGSTAANDFFQDWDTARRCASEAANLIGPAESDHLVDDLVLLKSRIVEATGIHDMLRAWSEGMVGDKTFQQLSEEFAEIVIPKVWEREDRKISRVAQSLSISPKKVRRILRNTGLLKQA